MACARSTSRLVDLHDIVHEEKTSNRFIESDVWQTTLLWSELAGGANRRENRMCLLTISAAVGRGHPESTAILLIAGKMGSSVSVCLVLLKFNGTKGFMGAIDRREAIGSRTRGVITDASGKTPDVVRPKNIFPLLLE